MRTARAAAVATWAVLVGVSGAADGTRLEVGLEGTGTHRMNDGEVLGRLAERALATRLPGGWSRARVTLRTHRGRPEATLEVSVTRPEDLPGVRVVEADLAVRGYREALDLGSPRKLSLELRSMRAVAEAGVFARAVASAGDEAEVTRIRPRQSFGLEQGDEATRGGFARAAEAAGFRPAGPPGGTRVINHREQSLWLLQGPLGAPVGNPGALAAEPLIAPGGRLALRVWFLHARRPRSRREVLAFERRVQERLDEWWSGLERVLDGQAYLTSGRIGADGDLVLEGVGYLSFHLEQGVLAQEKRRSEWRPTLRVNSLR